MVFWMLWHAAVEEAAKIMKKEAYRPIFYFG